MFFIVNLVPLIVKGFLALLAGVALIKYLQKN